MKILTDIILPKRSEDNPVDHGARQHSRLGASSCYRWWQCPGSVRLGSLAPTDGSSIYAQEGTAAHELAHLCLLNDFADPFDYVDTEIEGIVVDEEMAAGVEEYLDVCKIHTRDADTCFYEQRFSLDKLGPPEPMFGTADFIAIYEHRIVVVDFKYGKGLEVQARDNPQLKYYALGVFCALPQIRADFVEVMIVQPRIYGAIKSHVYRIEELALWSVELLAKAYETLDPDAPLHPGTWCRFCPASGMCPAQAKRGLAVAQIEFDDLVMKKSQEAVAPPVEIRLLTPVQMSALLKQAHLVEDWINSLKKAAMELLEQGNQIPGWKRVQGRPKREWADETAVVPYFEAIGVPQGKMETKKVISPAQAEKLLTEILRVETRCKAKEAKESAKNTIKEMVEYVSKTVNLVPEDDARPALSGPVGVEFMLEQKEEN